MFRPASIVSGLAALLTALPLVASLATPAAAQDKGMVSDLLEVRLTDEFRLIWNDKDSDADRSVSIWRPRVPSGWYSLGDLARPSHELGTGSKKPYAIIVRPRPGRDDALARPTGVTKVWDNEKSNGGVWTAFYVPNCPSGYTALGGLAITSVSNLDGNLRCVKNDAVAMATWKQPSVWDDKGSGARDDVTLWQPEYNGSGGKSFIIAPSTFWPMKQKGHESPDDQRAWALKLDFNTLRNPAERLSSSKPLAPPQVNGPGNMVLQSQNLPKEVYEVPFFQVKDSRYGSDTIAQWNGSPTYTIERTTKYEFTGDEMDNTNCVVQTGDAASISFTKSAGWEKSEESSWQVGGSFSLAATASFAPLGAGGEVTATVEVNTSKSWTSSQGTNGGTSVEKEWPVPLGTYGALFMVAHDYKVMRADKSFVSDNGYNDPQAILVPWSPPGWTAKNPCPQVDGLLFSTARDLERKFKYEPDGKSFYLIWDDIGDGDLVVLDEDENVKLSLKDNGIDTESIASVSFTEDGRLVAKDVVGKVVWATSYKNGQTSGAKLIMARGGVLQIIGPKNETIWSSAKDKIVKPEVVAATAPALRRQRVLSAN
ncbi:MAG: Vps62-related protein [Roseivivax sp.]|nr:Vps62-related protein [Roseivivax sp.]